jgi:multicomponent Na+:H+ antiporter subunit D
MSLIKHFPALQILLPFFGALFAILTFHYVLIARIIAIISILLSLLLSLYGLSVISAVPILYDFGNWHSPIGIGYRLDLLNQPILVYVNSVLLFLLIFCNKLISETIIKFIDKKRQSLFYAILLFAHAGYLGILSTNDLFNLYVFIEISSLSTYLLMAQGNNPKAVIGAFDYLMFGTIGATLMLIGIGFLLSATGSLNILDISTILRSHGNSRVIMTGISFFLIGTLLKTAFFPMHFWMMKAYNAAAPSLLVYLASISSIIGIYTILRFIHFTINYNQIINELANFIRVIALITIILCSYFAFRGQKIRNIVIYSTAAQIGYIFLLLLVPKGETLLFPFLFADSLNKIALFLLIAYAELGHSDNKSSMLWRVLVVFTLICNCGLPISSMFVIKLSIFELLIIEKMWLEFVIITISSSAALLYHYKLAKMMFHKQNVSYNYSILSSATNYYGLIFISILQFVLLIFLSQIQSVYNITLTNGGY